MSMRIAPDFQRCYCYRYFRFIYIGWVVAIKTNEPRYYCDNAKTVIMYPESWLDYVTIGFTKDSVMKKLRKHYENRIRH